MQKNTCDIFNEIFNLLRYESGQEIELKPPMIRKYADDTNILGENYCGFYYDKLHLITQDGKDYALGRGRDTDHYDIEYAPFRAEIILQEIVYDSRILKDPSKEFALRQVGWNPTFDDTVAAILKHNNALVINKKYWNDDIEKYFHPCDTRFYVSEKPYHGREEQKYPLYSDQKMFNEKDYKMDFRLAKTIADIVIGTIKKGK